MAAKKSSEAEPAVLPIQETPLPEPEAPPAGEVVVEPEEGAAAPAAQEAEKPDIRAQLEAMPEEERQALVEELAAERIRRAEQSGKDSAYDRLRLDQERRAQANQQLQDTLRNLDTEQDENKRAGHILAFADTHARTLSQQWAQDALESLRESLGVPVNEHDEIVLKLHQQGARDKRVPTFGDYVKAVTGERFMPRSEVTKKLRDEVNAAIEERLGKAREQEPAPVSVGQGEPASSSLTPDRYKGMSEEERRGLSPEQIDAMTRKYLA